CWSCGFKCGSTRRPNLVSFIRPGQQKSAVLWDLSRNSEQLKGFVTRPFGVSAAVSGTSARTLLLLTQRPRISDRPSMEDDILYWALVFFIIAIIAAFFGFGGVATTVASIAQILFFVFLVIFLIALVMGVAGRRRPPI